MKIKNIFTVLLVVFILASCAPAAKVVPTETPVPTPTFTPVLPTPTITLTPIPTINIEGQNIPDPRFSNPELFNLINPVAPIPQFINAMKMAGTEIDAQNIADELAKSYEVKTGVDGKPYILTTYTFVDENGTGYTMGLFSEQSEIGEWKWKDISSSLIASKGGIERGTLLEWYRTEQDSTYLETIKIDYNHISLNTEFMWKYIYPNDNNLNSYTLNQINAALKFAQANNLSVDLEGLTWGMRSQLPAWLVEGSFTQDELTSIMTVHIKTILAMYKGKFQRNNIVSEPFGNIWESSFWSDKLGLDNYVQAAFRVARETDPSAILTIVDINDSDKLFNLVKRLNDQELTVNNKKLIDAVGWEMPFFLPGSSTNANDYLDPQKRTATLENFRYRIRKYHEIGVEVYITELFIDITDVPGTMEQKLSFQAGLYRDIQRICSEEGVPVTTYSFYDNPTIYPMGVGRTEANPYPRNSGYQPKPSYYSLLDALVNTP